MRSLLLLALPWVVFSPWFGVAVYLFDGWDVVIVSSLASLLCLTVNFRTGLGTLRAGPPRPSPPQPPPDRQFLANLNHPPR